MSNPFQDLIVKHLGLGENALPEEKEEVLLRVGGVIYQNVIIRALENMSDDTADAYEKFLDRGAGPDEIFHFLKEKVPGFEEIIIEEAQKFGQKATSIMSKIG